MAFDKKISLYIFRIQIKLLNKKIVIGIITVILIVSVSIFIFEYIKFTKMGETFKESISLIRSGNYGQGIELCLTLPYYSLTCYVSAFGHMTGSNITITQEFCDGIPVNDQAPIWILKKDRSSQNKLIEFFRPVCNCMAQYNDKNKCMPMEGN